MRGFNKYLLLILAAAFAVGSILIGMKYSANKQSPATTTETITAKTNKNKDSANKSVSGLFLNQDHVFLKEDISDELITQAEGTLNKNDADEVKLFETAKVKWEIQKSLNNLFEQPALVGGTVTANAHYKQGVSASDKEAVSQKLSQSGISDEFANKVAVILNSTYGAGSTNSTSSTSSSEGTHTNTDLSLLTPSESDTFEVSRAKEQLSHVVHNGEVVSGFTMEGYQNAKEAIAVVPAGEVKDVMVSQLKLVETAMDNMGITYE